MNIVDALKDKILNGSQLADGEAYSLLDMAGTNALYNAARELTRRMCDRTFDSCSIANVRSGKCPENCKWCAQSAHYHTGCSTYDILSEEKCVEMARENYRLGVRRFSLVASGRSVRGAAIDEICSTFRRIKAETGISICASLGLLGREELQKLWNAGVRRYHCNLETAPSHFGTLCTTHTIADKLRTIALAREIGFEICSGGIIGMGETARQRVEFALALREAHPQSIPVNILCPIPGTPLADNPSLTDDEILTTLAIFRFVHPRLQIRFAGGRMKLSPETQKLALEIAVNGGIVGDLLTTIGSKIDADRELVTRSGYNF